MRVLSVEAQSPPVGAVSRIRAELESSAKQFQRESVKLFISKKNDFQVYSYMRAFGDGPRSFEPWSSDVDDTRAGTPLS
ncbi:hypothetical protein TNCV_4683611 [Trichonephila clavipes]|nr:hypothetical protein TNCV_4683611 [Trichonephila clavipes]